MGPRCLLSSDLNHIRRQFPLRELNCTNIQPASSGCSFLVRIQWAQPLNHSALLHGSTISTTLELGRSESGFPETTAAHGTSMQGRPRVHTWQLLSFFPSTQRSARRSFAKAPVAAKLAKQKLSKGLIASCWLFAARCTHGAGLERTGKSASRATTRTRLVISAHRAGCSILRHGRPVPFTVETGNAQCKSLLSRF